MVAASYSLVQKGIIGNMAYAIYTWLANDDSSVSIVTGNAGILDVKPTFKTAQRGTFDWTTTPGTIAITGLTSSDTGTVFVLFRAE